MYTVYTDVLHLAAALCCSLTDLQIVRCPQIVWPGRAGQGRPRPGSARNRLKRSRSVGWLGWAGQGLTTLLGCATSRPVCCRPAAQFLLFAPRLCPSWICPAASRCNQSCCCPHSTLPDIFAVGHMSHDPLWVYTILTSIP